MLPRNLTLHAIGNAHIDPVWLWRWPEGLETIRATFASALDRMAEFPDFHFTGSSAAFYEMLRDVDPALFEQVRARVREGRWEIVGGWWIQPDANIPGGEALVRQGLYGQRFLLREFGVRATVGYNPDTFGHTGSLPQILRGMGMTRYVFMRPGPHEMALPANVFRWRSPDGSEVVAARILGGYCTWPGELEEHATEAEQGAPAGLEHFMLFYGVGNHGGGPTIRNIESLRAMARRPTGTSVTLSTLGSFFSAVEARTAAGAQLPVVGTELQHHARGCYSAHAGIKRDNRRVEHLLLAAERAAAVARLAVGRSYPREALETAWRGLLFNQFHDILAGTSLPDAYVDARDLHGQSAAIASRELNHALQAVAAGVPTRGAGEALVVWNLLPWPVQVPVEIERGPEAVQDEQGVPVSTQQVRSSVVTGQRRTCFVCELPALGYRVVRGVLSSGGRKPTAGLRVTQDCLENDWWRLDFGRDGQLLGLHDKRHRVDLLNPGGAAALVMDDPSDTWSHDVVAYMDEVGRFRGERARVVEEGPVRAAVETDSQFGTSRMVTTYRLYRDIARIECDVTVDWHERRRVLKLSLSTKLADATVTADAGYGQASRAANGEEEPMQQWVDLSGTIAARPGGRVPYGLAVLNDGLHGYDCSGGTLRLTALRSPVFAHHDPAKLDGDGYHYMDQGRHVIRLRLAPHLGDWREAGADRLAWEHNCPPICVHEYEHDGTLPTTAGFAATDAPNVLISVLKGSEDGDDIVVRAYETAGRTTRALVFLPASHVSWPAQFRPHAIQSWKVRLDDGPSVEPVDLLEGKDFLTT